MRCLAPALAVALTVAVALALGGSTAVGRTAGRVSRVNVTAPAQFDLTLAELRFPGRPGPPGHLALGQAPGLYYVAGALVRRPSRSGPRALVLVVNERPRGSLAPDLLRLGLRVTADRALGSPSLRQRVNPFPRPAGSGLDPRLCGLGARHGAADLRAVLSGGRPLPGYGVAAAVAQAYDVACGLPYDSAFARAVTGCGTSLVAGCCPPNAVCALPAPTPTPTPTPTPVPVPVCPPCPRPPCPTPAACPLLGVGAVTPRVCPLAGAPALAC